jgi:hypothetical protein
MVERNTQESIHDKAASSTRSPLLMPIMEGDAPHREEVAELLRSRLSFLREWTSALPSAQLS